MPPPYPAGRGFNTQPPEGGWDINQPELSGRDVFQHTAARRRLAGPSTTSSETFRFQHTAARRRLAPPTGKAHRASLVSTHSRPKAAGPLFSYVPTSSRVSTHSRPKAAGSSSEPSFFTIGCFNTQPPEGGWPVRPCMLFVRRLFQHTAARRRLERYPRTGCQHTRFNTQPPEGGWLHFHKRDMSVR